MCVSVFVSVRVSVSLCVHVYVVCGFCCFCICFVFSDNVFMGDGGMGVVALIRKNTGVLGGAGHYNLCWPEYLGGVFLFLVGGQGAVKLQLLGVGKLIGR